MRISRSPGAVTIVALACCCSLGMSCVSLRAFEELPEAIKAVIEHPAVVGDPRLDVVEPSRPEPAAPDAADLLGRHQLGLLEDLHVLLHPRQRDAGGTGELGDG